MRKFTLEEVKKSWIDLSAEENWKVNKDLLGKKSTMTRWVYRWSSFKLWRLDNFRII